MSGIRATVGGNLIDRVPARDWAHHDILARFRRSAGGFVTLLALAFALFHPFRAGGTIDAKALTPTIGSAPARMGFDRIEVVSAAHTRLGSAVLPSIIQGADWDGRRPLVVVFNGGPGAASGWLELGALGPLLAVVPDDPAAPIPHHLPLAANRNGLWDSADMLFVDPLGTGFSRAAPLAADAAIHDWRGDGEYIARLVRDWMAIHHRQAQPVVLLGESYGTERAVAVADALSAGSEQLPLRGIVLVSQSIVTGNSLHSQGNASGTALDVPTMAATACYFGRSTLAATPPEACARQALAFVHNQYLPALAAGKRLAVGRRAAVIARLGGLTGLSGADFAPPRLAITSGQYLRMALADRNLVLGAHDSRYAAPYDPARPWQDPSLDALLPAMTDAAQRASAMALGLARSPVDRTPYVLFDGGIPRQWHYGERADPRKSLDMMAILGQTLRRSGARLMIAGGLFDAAGSYGADRFLAAHLDLPRSRIDLRSYPGGHMFYLNSVSRAGFVRSLRGFVGGAAISWPPSPLAGRKSSSNGRA